MGLPMAEMDSSHVAGTLGGQSPHPSAEIRNSELRSMTGSPRLASIAGSEVGGYSMLDGRGPPVEIGEGRSEAERIEG